MHYVSLPLEWFPNENITYKNANKCWPEYKNYEKCHMISFSQFNPLLVVTVGHANILIIKFMLQSNEQQ